MKGLERASAGRRVGPRRAPPQRSVAYALPLKGKPAALVRRLRGQSGVFPSVRQCAATGDVLARLRAAGYDKPFTELEEGVARYVKDFLTHPDPYC